MILYFISRIIVVYNPEWQRQEKFYEGHKHKVSCIYVHPNKNLVVSGEQSGKIGNPSIHVWNCINLESQNIISTYHNNGVLKLCTSKCGRYIASVGMDVTYSLQITNWVTNEVIAFRNTSESPIFDLTFNPYDKNILVTTGYQNIIIWSIYARNLSRH